MFTGNLVTYHFLFTTRIASAHLDLDKHSGAALRGSLFNAIWRRFCTNKAAASCAECPLHDMCPVSRLVAPLRDDNARGRDIPRPFVVHPPLDGEKCYRQGERLLFGVTLFGTVVTLLPYLVLAAGDLEEEGLGKEFGGRRGRYDLVTIESYHPFTGERQVIYDKGQPQVDVPPLCVTPADVAAKAAQLPADSLTLNFLTPVRLIEDGREAPRATFRPLVQRLIERLTALERSYGVEEGAECAAERRRELIRLAEKVEARDAMLGWEQLRSWSNRQQQGMMISGFLGQVTYVGDLTPFRELLTWGELINVGKAAVKGNGWFTVSAPVPVAKLFIA